MLKKNKWRGIVSSILILLPLVAGLLLWDRLPETMNVHWGADGVADGTGSRWMAVFLLPLILLILHWVCLIITASDPKNKNRNSKAMGIVFWIMPVCSLFVCSFVYAIALGHTFSASHWVVVMIALMFLLLGNYMPKVQQNSTFGIKISWALRNEENWNKTHRFGGKLWFACGFVILFSLFLPMTAMIWVMTVVLLAACIAPVLYSYLLYRKQRENGESFIPSVPLTRGMRITRNLSLVIVAVILVLTAVLMFTGEIQVHFAENSFLIEASYHEDLTVVYDEIDAVIYREACDPGTRTFGFGSPRLSMGTFENGEFGSYTRYTYTACKAGIVIASDGRILLINGRTEPDTLRLYEELLQRIN